MLDLVTHSAELGSGAEGRWQCSRNKGKHVQSASWRTMRRKKPDVGVRRVACGKQAEGPTPL